MVIHSSLYKAIRDCISKYGIDIIKSTRLANILADFDAFEEVPATKQVLKAFLISGYGNEVAGIYVRQLPWKKKMQAFARELVNKHGLKEGLVNYTLECVEYGLGWIDEEPKYDPTAPSLPAGYSNGSFIPDMNKQLGLMQKEYLSMLEQLITVPERRFYKQSGYYSASALSQLWVVENKIDIISAAIGKSNSDWCRQEKQRVLNKYAQSKGKQFVLLFLKTVLPAILAVVMIVEGIQYLSSLKEISDFKTTMEKADMMFNAGDYQSALLTYQDAQKNYSGSFTKKKYNGQAQKSVEKASAIIISSELDNSSKLIKEGRYFDAKMKIDSLSLLPCSRESNLALIKKRVELDEVIKTALDNSRITLSQNISRNKGKLDKVGRTELEELLKVAPDDYWLNFLKNKEKI